MQTSDHKVLGLLFRGSAFQAPTSVLHLRLLAGALTQSDLVPKESRNLMLAVLFEGLDLFFVFFRLLMMVL